MKVTRFMPEICSRVWTMSRFALASSKRNRPLIKPMRCFARHVSRSPFLTSNFEPRNSRSASRASNPKGQIRQAEAELAAAEAALAQQEAAYKLAVFDRDAYVKLAKSGAVSERQGKQAETNAETQVALVAAARRRVESAKAAVSATKASEVNPQIITSQGSVIQQQIAQQQAQVASAEAQAAQARARLTEAQANRRDFEVRAPFDGTVATRTAEPGEVVNAGTPLLTLIDLSKVYLRGFVPGRPDRPRAHRSSPPASISIQRRTRPRSSVSRIDPQATFTPENTYFRDDRVKQVVGVKLQLKGATGFAKPGMPADGEVLVEGAQWPAKRTAQIDARTQPPSTSTG